MKEAPQRHRGWRAAFQHGVKPGQTALPLQEGSWLYPATLRSDSGFQKCSDTQMSSDRVDQPHVLGQGVSICRFGSSSSSGSFTSQAGTKQSHTQLQVTPKCWDQWCIKKYFGFRVCGAPRGTANGLLLQACKMGSASLLPCGLPGNSYSTLTAVCKGLSFYLWVTGTHKSTAYGSFPAWVQTATVDSY